MRARIVAASRECLGTPFRHQGRVPGHGLDCVGLAVHVGHSLGLVRYDVRAYSRLPAGGELERHLAVAGLRSKSVEAALPGDLYLMVFESDPQHVAIKTDRGIIHAYLSARRVVEHGLNDIWRRRIVGAYAFPGL